MICQTCKQETEKGKFCTNCGAPLASDEAAATVAPTSTDKVEQTPDVTEVPVASTTTNNQADSNEFVEQVKSAATNFSDFFLRFLKAPSKAKDTTQKDLISSIITVVIFSLIIATRKYVIIRSSSFEFFAASNPFFDGFFLPLLKYIILFGLITVLIFAATKVADQKVSLIDIIAKYGAYLVPLLPLSVVGLIFSIIKLEFPFTSFSIVALLSAVLIVPALILKEKPVKGFDYVHVLIVLNLVCYIAYNYLS